jgi:hypothetical protein
VLIGIPKYLIRVFMVVFAFSFVYMFYVLNNEQYTLDFLNASDLDHDFESGTEVHPLF